MEMQNILNYIIITLLCGCLIATISCRRPNAKNEEDKSMIRLTERGEQEDLTAMIRNYFDSQKWKYRQYTEEDSVDSFLLGFTGLNEEVMVRVDVMPNQNMYKIIGQSKTVIPESYIMGAVKAINRYNLRAKVVSGCISEDGSVTFWMGRNTDGGSFSEEAFGCDFDMVMMEADNATAHIFKESMEE